MLSDYSDFILAKTCFQCYKGRIDKKMIATFIWVALDQAEKSFCARETSERVYARTAIEYNKVRGLCEGCNGEKKIFHRLFRRFVFNGPAENSRSAEKQVALRK